jgi:hypothetical protein
VYVHVYVHTCAYASAYVTVQQATPSAASQHACRAVTHDR